MAIVWSKWLLLILLVGIGWSTGQPQAVEQPHGDAHIYLPLVRLPPGIPMPTKIDLVPFATGFSSSAITSIAHAGDDRLFVAEQSGRIRIVEANGTVRSTPFLDISTNISTSNWEEGLLGLVFHPDYPNTPYFYVSYTREDHKIQIARLSVSDNGNIADPEIKPVMLIGKSDDNGNPSPVHNAGDMHFGPDGYLYIAIGDGGPDPASSVPGDPKNNGQRLDKLLGKIVRIDTDPDAGQSPDCGADGDATVYYSIPFSNPYANQGGCDEIWSLGWRNPWRFSFDRLTGDMFIADVGEWKWEELNIEPAGSPGGRNYGWHCYEGTYDYTQTQPDYITQCSQVTDVVMPIYEYGNGPGELGCSIVGGFVYRGSQQPLLDGRYLFGDFCSGRVWVMTNTEKGWEIYHEVPLPGFHVSTFGENLDGELFVGNWKKPGSSQELTISKVVVTLE